MGRKTIAQRRRELLDYFIRLDKSRGGWDYRTVARIKFDLVAAKTHAALDYTERQIELAIDNHAEAELDA